MLVEQNQPNRGFHKRTKLTIFALLSTLYSHFCSFSSYLQHIRLVNMKLDISGYNRITFQGCRLHWNSSFLMVQPKRSWQYLHSCIVENLWKNPIFYSWSCIDKCIPYDFWTLPYLLGTYDMFHSDLQTRKTNQFNYWYVLLSLTIYAFGENFRDAMKYSNWLNRNEYFC